MLLIQELVKSKINKLVKAVTIIVTNKKPQTTTTKSFLEKVSKIKQETIKNMQFLSINLVSFASKYPFTP